VGKSGGKGKSMEGSGERVIGEPLAGG